LTNILYRATLIIKGEKMKKNLLVFTILISMFSVINVSQANATCTAGDPCGTWAMLDSQGVVTNVIVCQASVCGGGTWAGQTVVPQVAPNPSTNDTFNTSSFISNDTQTVTHSEGIFTIQKDSILEKNVVEINNDTITVSKVFIPIVGQSFSYNDTIDKLHNEIIMEPRYNENGLTTVSVYEKSLINQLSESIQFNERKTSTEIESAFVSNNLNLLLSKINVLISLLGTWVK
jgi:hypothetical protein